MNTNAMDVFKSAFLKTSGVSLVSYSMSVRFIAAILICVAGILAISCFMNQSNKESETFMTEFVVFWAKVFIGVFLSLVFLII